MYMTDKWEGTEHFHIKRFKYIEFYVGNAKQAVHFYRHAFGFLLMLIVVQKQGFILMSLMF